MRHYIFEFVFADGFFYLYEMNNEYEYESHGMTKTVWPNL